VWAIALWVLLHVGVSVSARSDEQLGDSSGDSKLYCGTFHWTGKFAPDAIWIEDGKFNVSLDNETTKNYEKYYTSKGGLQGHSDGDCVCVKGMVKKVPVDQTSGDKGWLVIRLDGIYACNNHTRVQ
jgi:hypothetical protein